MKSKVERILVDNALIGFFSQFPKNKVFYWNREEVHPFFEEMQKRFPELLSGMGFKEGYLFSESSELDTAYANLSTTIFLEAWIAGGDVRVRHKARVDLFEYTLRTDADLNFSPEQMKQFGEMAEGYLRRYSIKD